MEFGASELSESEVAIRFILFVGGGLISIYLVNRILRRILKVEKNSSEPSYVNALHKKWDKIVRIITGIALVIIAFVFFGTNTPINISLFLLAAALTVLPLLVQIGFEKRYAANPNQYLYTTLELGTTGVIVVTLLYGLSPGF